MSDIVHELEQKKKELQQEISEAENKKSAENIKTKYLKSFMGELYKKLKTSEDPELKKQMGRAINEFKEYASEKIDHLIEEFVSEKKSNKYDNTIFKNNIKIGHYHPITKLYKKIEKVLISMGFSVVQGPEIELDRYNFEKLNIPAHHPARDMQDTFYVSIPNILLRSHTSSVQIRTMETRQPPIQIISPGTVYRVDDIDPQHTPMFYQVEGLMVGEKISFSNLKAILTKLLKEIFGNEAKDLHIILILNPVRQ